MGDAAFVARPHAAAGTAKAAEDAWKLAEAIKAADGEVIAALRIWESGQLGLGRSVLARTREAGGNYSSRAHGRLVTPCRLDSTKSGTAL